MNHHKSVRKFGRVKKQRKALLNSLARSLVLHGKIQTTEAKAKELRPNIEKMVTKAKTPTIAIKRSLSATIGKEASAKLLDQTKDNFMKRNGGYTRITKVLSTRKDAGKVAIIEFV